MGLGRYPDVSLSDARISASEMHKQIKSGVNPIEERKAAKVCAKQEAAKNKTFRERADESMGAVLRYGTGGQGK